MADNENKIVLNVPGQANVDPSEVTHEALKDPLSGRDTDTGSLDRMSDTQTRKTVKIKPSTSGAVPVPVVSLGSTASVRVVAVAPASAPADAARPKDVLASRDTDTGNLDRMSDTQTRKTVKLSPISSGTGPVPVMKLGTVAAPAANTGAVPRPAGAADDDTRTRQTVVLKTPPSPAVNTESIPITTLPYPVSPADDDTRTRQTVVLKTPSAPAINTESIPITTLPRPVSLAEDDTRTRQSVVLKSPASQVESTESIPITTLPGSAGLAEDDTRTRQSVVLKTSSTPIPVGTESAPLSDVLAGRDTDTGNMERMDDTKTKKTIKLTPLTAGGPISKLAPLGKPAGAPAPFVLPKPGSPPANLAATVELKPVAVSPESAAPPVNFAATVELKPVVMPVPGQSAPVSTDTGSLKDVLGDTSTRKTVKLQPLPPGAAAAPVPVVSPVAAPAVAAAPAPAEAAAVPAPAVAPVSTDTGSLKNVLEDTSTRKTVKLQPLPPGAESAPAAIDLEKTVVSPTVPQPVPAAPDAEPMVKDISDDTVKLQKTHAPAPAAHEAASPLPTVAQAKTVVPGAKQTIKLRPSTGGGTVPPEEPASAAVKSAAGSSKDTIKISPLSTNGAQPAVAPSAPTLNLAPKAPTPAPALAPSTPTAKLPTPAAGGVAPSSPTVNLSAPPGLTLKKPSLTPVSAPAPVAAPEPPKAGLSLPGKSPSVKPPEPPAEEEEPPVVEEAESAGEEEEAVAEEKKGGLQLKKRETGDEPQGPPRVQTDMEKIEDSHQQFKRDAAGQPSMLYFALALVSVLCLAASTYISAAQYVNYWQQAKIKSKLPVSFVSQFVK